MVAQMGPTSVGPVSSCTGVENHVWATTPIEILNSGGSTLYKIGMHTMFKFKFAAVVRTDKKSHIHNLSTIASSEREARRQFASRFVLVLSARIPVSGVAA